MPNISLDTSNKTCLQWILCFLSILGLLLFSCKTDHVIKNPKNKNNKNLIHEFHENKEYILNSKEYEKFEQDNSSVVQNFAGIQYLGNLDKYIDTGHIKKYDSSNTSTDLKNTEYKNSEAGFSYFIDKSLFYDLVTRILFCDFISVIYSIVTTLIVRYIDKCSRT